MDVERWLSQSFILAFPFGLECQSFRCMHLATTVDA